MPHRHRRLERQRRRFYTGLGFSVLATCALVILVSFTLERLHTHQRARNELLEQTKAEFQAQENRVRQLQNEIGVLVQRQSTVSALQLQRNVPVALFNELARLMPNGVALTSVRQNDLKLTIGGLAASNERVSDLMAGLQNDSTVLQQPELVEMRSATVGAPSRTPPSTFGANPDVDRAPDRLVDFTLTVVVRRDALAAGGRP